MSKRNEKTSPSESSTTKNGWTDAISIISCKDENGFQIIRLFGYDIRALIEDEEPWFVLSDLSEALGIHRNTIPNLIKRNSRIFEGWVKSAHVTCARENFNDEITVGNEQAIYFILSRLSESRVKTAEARETVFKFQKAFPELLKMIRRGELQISQSEEWDYKRYLAAQGAKFLGDSIHSFIQYLARDPKHEPFVHMNNHKMINTIVFGRHEKGIRDTATKDELEIVHALELIDGVLIKSGMVKHQDRKERLQAECQMMKSKLISFSSHVSPVLTCGGIA